MSDDMVSWDRVLKLAAGCSDYGGGHSGRDREIYQEGIWVVGNVLRQAREQGTAPDTQLQAVEGAGSDIARLTRERDEACRSLRQVRMEWDALWERNRLLSQTIAEALAATNIITTRGLQSHDLPALVGQIVAERDRLRARGLRDLLREFVAGLWGGR